MEIELYCAHCGCQFAADADTPAGEIIDRMVDEGTWFVLADGDSFEDMLFHAVLARDHIACPDCGHSMYIQEKSWGEFVREWSKPSRSRAARRSPGRVHCRI